jgi:hypothetical protein
MKTSKQKFKIIDNFLPEAELADLNGIIMSAGFPWYTNTDGVAYKGDFSDKYFIHMMYTSGQPNSSHYSLLNPIVVKLGAKAILRAKVNLYLQGNSFIEHGTHRDYPFSHKAFLLYLNTNNGFTRLADGQIIESIANRAVIFNGNQLHNSTNCTDALFRANISINYL